jgi:glycosyltransferase involved in cell wall biosynthesis
MHSVAPADPGTLGLPRDVQIILFAGRLTHQKNVELFIEAADDVIASRDNSAALIFGEGPLRAAAENLISQCRRRERIRLLGYTNDLWEWMRRASVFVSPSYFEGSPTTVLEAMALGCPLVVSQIKEHEEILDTASAFFCNPGSASDIARTIGQCLDDPAGTTARVQVARLRSSIYSIDAASRKYAAIYSQVAKKYEVKT